ncbi:pyruvate dehydrogenase phosphatase regulatory subunit, mitochondrial-like [Artemia franciscana]|uniref:pyruvate dehydrogenase phosphatase regulatory subunit, mitochondrial-like n=1 Tax=Artemia franciscana TaxID=6661 RepID=UPI0032DB094D
MLKKISASQFSGKDLMTISHRKTKRLLTSSAMKKKYVICGAGLQGTAVAHAFSLMGLGKDTLLLDQGRVGGGTTKYAAGFVGVYKQTPVESMLVKESLALYRKLHDEGHDIGWNQCGSLLLAQTRDRVTAFRRMKAAAVQRDIHCEWLQPEAIEKRYPYLATKDVLAGIFIPEDGTILPEKLCNVLVHQCKANGVTVVENCNVSSILCKAGKVVGAETSIGRIDCDYLINCAGLWARALGKQSRPVVRVPVQACQHHHLVTKQTELATNPMPAIRDMDASVYLRVRDGGFLIGGLEPNAKPVFEDGTPPANWEPKFLEPDWDYFTPSLEKALKRFPALRDVMLERLVCGPETFAPDGKWVVGEAPEVDNYFVAAGMNTMGSSSAGGVGKLIAQWVVEGRAPYPLYALDVQRFLPLHNNRKFLLARAKEVPSWMNQVPYPFNEFRSGRKLRMSPLYARLRDAGAVFGQVMGFERASWYESEENGKILKT